jgi:signal transduction histidine kinase
MDRPAAIAKLAALLLEKESRAVEVARLLHDDVGPTLSGVGFHLHAIGVDPATMDPIREYLEQAMDGVRAASNKLQSNVVERSGLPLALQLLVERQTAEHRTPIHLDTTNAKRLAPPIAHAVYRIIELALQNALQHAAASAIHIRLSAGSVEIRDNGVGFDPAQVRVSPPGIGLILMESYAGSVNLQLRVDSGPEQGTIINIQTI